MAIYKEDIVNIELSTGKIFRSFLEHTIGAGDELANRFGVRVFRNGVAENIGGTCFGLFVRADGTTVTIASGVVSGNEAYVTLPESCYAVEGQFTLAIKCQGGGTTGTLRIVDGVVSRTSTDAAVDPGTVIPSVEALIEAIDEAVESIPQDYSDLSRTVDYIIEQYGMYAFGEIEKPYDRRIAGPFRMVSNIGTSEDVYGTGSRAILKPIEIVDGKLTVYNPDGYLVGVYYRKKSDGSYVGYAQSATSAPCFTLASLDTATYDYIVMVIHTTAGTESNWTETDLDAMNRRVFIYTGNYNDNQEELGLKVSSNLIKPGMIHIGKYYYGASAPATNADMAYTDLIPIREKRKYIFPYLTLGYSWYQADQTTVISGNYTAVESVAARDPYIVLEAPTGAAYIGVSVRSGDVPNMVLSELPDSKTTVDEVSILPVAKSRIVREPLNWIYNMDFRQTVAGSRIQQGNTVVFDGSKATISDNGTLFCADQICMDKSKTDIVFAIPNSGTPSFILGNNGYYAQTSLGISDGAIAVWFKSDGTAEVRMGTGNGGSYDTVLASLPLTGLQINNGRKFVLSIEKDTINKYIVSLYDAMTPNNVATVTIEAEQNPQDENLYTGQIRGWGGPFAKCFSGGSVQIYKMQMYSTAPAYPRVAVWGDSYVENCGRNPDCGYANLMRKELDGDVFVSGQGGATAQQTSYRVAAEINSCAPQYIIFNVGVNDSFNVSVDSFKTALLRLIAMAEAKGAVPVLITVPNVPAGNSTTAAFCAAANPWIRSLGYAYIDVAYALSNGDGSTGDTNKFVADMTHPNLAAGQAIFNYIKANLPELLWK